MKLFVGWRLLLISMLLIAPFFTWALTRTVKSQSFDDNCTYHINEALTTNDLNYSSNEIGVAIAYLEKNNLTSGYTTIFDKYRSEDLSIFYSQIKKRNEYINSLKKIPPEELEKYQEFVSMRNLRGTTFSVADTTPQRASISIPEGISVYPHNILYLIWMIVSILLSVFGIMGIMTFIDERSSPRK